MIRLLPNRPASVRVTLAGQDGALVVPDGAVAVVAYDAADEEIASGAATDETGGVFRFDLTAAEMAELGVFRVVWSFEVGGVADSVTSSFEVVGAHLFTVAEARAFDAAKLADETKYPAAAIIDGREYVEQYLEDLCGVGFVPHGRTVLLDGLGDEFVRLPFVRVSRIVSVYEDGAEVVEADYELDADLGRLYRTSGYWGRGANVEVRIEHGYDQAPLAVKRAGLLLLRARLVASNIDDRALSVSDDSGTRQLAVPGAKHPTGIPEVDAVIAQYGERYPILR